MAYKEVSDLSADTAFAIGGYNKKQKKENPTSVEGYFLGTKMVQDSKNPAKLNPLHIFQTPKGNVGVWGKTDLNGKLRSVSAGTMTLVTFTGMQPTKNGEMYKYKVQTDADNTIDVVTPSAIVADDGEPDFGNEESEGFSAEEADEEDAKQNEALAAAERRAKVEALLKTKKR